MNVKECIFFQLASASRSGTHSWNRQVDEWELTGVQAMVINAIGEEDNIVLNRLGEKLQLANATLTGIIDRLEKTGWVERTPNHEDRRSLLVGLTKKAQQHLPKLAQRMEEANRAFLTGLSREEEMMLRGLLTRLTP